jgi:transcriptional regulator with XRE-family HTH domain
MAAEPEKASEETSGQIVRRARGRRSLDAFAQELGTSRQRVIAWEKERSLPSDRYAKQIAEIAGVDPAVFARVQPQTLSEGLSGIYELLDELRSAAEEKGYLERGELGTTALPAELDARLRSIEGAVEALSSATAESLRSLAAGIRKIDRRLAAEAPPGTASEEKKKAR